ncbi:crotonase/enoyl-CoA hydratase family protein [Sphingomonas sp. C3-2]|uniref:crotonase/enoyl-CoA hydratase family protein n=1 Tax=Sphingomonas sp. C3-2 TaxID=3062169 RepID=UPI00294B1A83|nr:crotonase/enoyl-CoA hydratase family protein [Sphingomonas sp. C3-2]WOK37972.1 crotonase/enoyl-CoA hydratase family protein [Sphingomonas sp. C3-2]
MPEFSTISTDIEDAILTITLNRPDKLNAFTREMMHELIAAFDLADADDAVRAVIVTGAGRAFCAGADLSAGASTFDYEKRAGWNPEAVGNSAYRDGGGMLTLRIFNCRKPVIAAINGPAVGIGATMTLAMDFRLASEAARIGFVFSRRGIVPEAASSWFLPRIVGIGQALEWVYSGRVFDAAEAERGGLVRAVHGPDDLLPAARAFARSLTNDTAPVSVALARQMLWRMMGASHPMEAHRLESRAMYSRGRSNDAKEGITAFLEKRASAYPDRVSADMPHFAPWMDDPDY